MCVLLFLRRSEIAPEVPLPPTAAIAIEPDRRNGYLHISLPQSTARQVKFFLCRLRVRVATAPLLRKDMREACGARPRIWMHLHGGFGRMAPGTA